MQAKAREIAKRCVCYSRCVVQLPPASPPACTQKWGHGEIPPAKERVGGAEKILRKRDSHPPPVYPQSSYSRRSLMGRCHAVGCRRTHITLGTLMHPGEQTAASSFPTVLGWRRRPSLPLSLSLSPVLWETAKAASVHGIISVDRVNPTAVKRIYSSGRKDALGRAVLIATCGRRGK